MVTSLLEPVLRFGGQRIKSKNTSLQFVLFPYLVAETVCLLGIHGCMFFTIVVLSCGVVQSDYYSHILKSDFLTPYCGHYYLSRGKFFSLVTPCILGLFLG